VETGQVRPSDLISTTDEAYALVNVEGNLKRWTKEADFDGSGKRKNS
jgi:hypothetical protein